MIARKLGLNCPYAPIDFKCFRIKALHIKNQLIPCHNIPNLFDRLLDEAHVPVYEVWSRGNVRVNNYAEGVLACNRESNLFVVINVTQGENLTEML